MSIDAKQTSKSHERHVVYLKLRKTGGTTLASSILFPYCVKHGLSYMDPVDWWAVHPRLVAGEQFHMMFRHFPDFPQPWARTWLRDVIGKYRLITLLREPVSRLLSDFNHLSHYHRTMTFSQYLESHHEPNHQSRWLGFDGRDPDFIRKRFSAVGITERFDESMLLFRHCLGLSLEDVLYVRQRSDVDKRLRLSDLGQEAIDELKDINWLDVKLYEQANATFDRYLDDVPEMSKELEVYRSALNDFRHPLWSRRGTFPIGYTARYVWSEFDSEHARVRDLRELPS
jgi:hypothetical protein